MDMSGAPADVDEDVGRDETDRRDGEWGGEGQDGADVDDSDVEEDGMAKRDDSDIGFEIAGNECLRIVIGTPFQNQN